MSGRRVPRAAGSAGIPSWLRRARCSCYWRGSPIHGLRRRHGPLRRSLTTGSSPLSTFRGVTAGRGPREAALGGPATIAGTEPGSTGRRQSRSNGPGAVAGEAGCWRARQDSNPGPGGPKPPALSTELRAREEPDCRVPRRRQRPTVRAGPRSPRLRSPRLRSGRRRGSRLTHRGRRYSGRPSQRCW